MLRCAFQIFHNPMELYHFLNHHFSSHHHHYAIISLPHSNSISPLDHTISGVFEKLFPHLGHSRTPSACSAISFVSSVLSEPISDAAEEADKKEEEEEEEDGEKKGSDSDKREDRGEGGGYDNDERSGGGGDDYLKNGGYERDESGRSLKECREESCDKKMNKNDIKNEPEVRHLKIEDLKYDGLETSEMKVGGL